MKNEEKERLKINTAEILDKANKLVSRAEKLIPKILEPNLPPTELLPDVPDWHDFERKIWRLGDEIRQLIKENPTLRKENEFFQRILKISTNRNAKRGRQSFIMLFATKHLSGYAKELTTQLDDEFVNGHIICAIQKMHAAEFDSEVKPFAEHKHVWIRNAAKKYLTQKNE
ncbi:MAG: hypothetical protein LBU73_08085 [Helicobacteraceae bacterium]|jgi:hypothetical protein|nr:hypothetical protein [Helicobacteraceae bacterium]